jgi:hypothetical protein
MNSAEHIYTLDIYEPRSSSKVWLKFTSQNPFMPINVGDLLNPSIWPETGERLLEVIRLLRVTNLEHIVWTSDGQARHTILVYTEQVEDTEETRLNR